MKNALIIAIVGLIGFTAYRYYSRKPEYWVERQTGPIYGGVIPLPEGEANIQIDIPDVFKSYQNEV